MDSKWGGIIIAALAGLGIGAFITHEKSPKAMKAEMVEPEIEEESEEPFDKRPQLDDFVEMNVAKMVEHLKWLQQHPQFNKRNMQVNKLLNDPNNGLQKVLDSYNIKRRKDDKREFPPLEFHNYTVYADKYGKCPEGFTPTGHGWVTGDCIKTLEDGTEMKWEGEKDIGSKGPLNTFFDRSGYLKHDTPMAMHLARETLHETGKYYTKKELKKHKDPVEKLRAQYYDKQIQEELMDNQTMDEYAHWLWLEQFTKNNRKVLRGQDFLMPFDIDTCRQFIEYLYVEATYQGYVVEEKAIEEMTDSYAYKGSPFKPIYRKDKSFKLFDDIAVTFTGKTMDLTHKVDLLVRPKGEDDVVLAGVQVKPLSFFTQGNTLETMLKKHRILGGDFESLTTSKKEKKREGKNIMPKIDMFPDKDGNKKSIKPKAHFNVQTLVYDGYSKEFLNYEAVMFRIQYNIPDPILTDLPEWKTKKDTDGRTTMKNFFLNQINAQRMEVKEKYDEAYKLLTGLQTANEAQKQREAKRQADIDREKRRKEQMVQDALDREKEEVERVKRAIKARRDREREKKRREDEERKNPYNPFEGEKKRRRGKHRRLR